MLKELRKIILPVSVFFAATCLFFYPVILRITRFIPAFYSTDEPYGVVWSFWWLKYSFLRGIPESDLNLLAYPGGMKLSFFAAWGVLAKYMGALFGEIAAYNLILLLTFLLAGLGMYLLVRYLTGSEASGIFSGLIYAFCPYHLVRVWQHFGTAQIQWMPFYMLFLLRLRRSASRLDAFMLAVFFTLNYYYDVHYAYFMALITGIFFLQSLFLPSEKTGRVKLGVMIFCALACGVLLTLPVLFPFLMKVIGASRDTQSGAYSLAFRPFADLFSQSARPLSYLLPFTEQPFFGKVTQPFIGSQFWGESLTEHNVFLGFIPLALSFMALRRRKALISYYASRGIDAVFSFNFFLLLCITSWVFSQPPWWNIFGFKLYMPSFFLYKLFPMVRAYGRFAIVLMLGVSVLAGLSLDFLSAKFSAGRRTLIAAVLSILVLFEFSFIPAEHTADLGVYPAAYEWLKEQPEGSAIAEYPLDLEGPNELYKFYQTKHHHPIINGAFPGTAAHKVLQGLSKLSSPATAGALSDMGVKYVFVHMEDYKKMGLSSEIEDAEGARLNKGFKFARDMEGIEIYEVTGGAGR